MRRAEATQQGSGVAPDNRSIRFRIDPRLVPASKAARILHLSPAEFAVQLPALRGAGFPVPCSITGHYDRVAIGAWLDRRAGLAVAASVPNADALIHARLDALG